MLTCVGASADAMRLEATDRSLRRNSFQLDNISAIPCATLFHWSQPIWRRRVIAVLDRSIRMAQKSFDEHRLIVQVAVVELHCVTVERHDDESVAADGSPVG